VTRLLGVGTGRQPDEVGRIGARGPELAAIDHKTVGIFTGGGFQYRQIAASTGFGVTDGEVDVPGGDPWQEFILLQRRAVGHQRRANGTDGHEWQWRAGDIGFFKENQLLGRAITLPAIGLGPAYRQPAIATDLRDGAAKQLATFGTAHLLAQLGGHQVLEIVPDLESQCMLFRGEIDKHGDAPPDC